MIPTLKTRNTRICVLLGQKNQRMGMLTLHDAERLQAQSPTFITQPSVFSLSISFSYRDKMPLPRSFAQVLCCQGQTEICCLSGSAAWNHSCLLSGDAIWREQLPAKRCRCRKGRGILYIPD